MVPDGWTGRRVRLEYVAGAGGTSSAIGLSTRDTSGKLLAVVGAGPVLAIAGSRALFPWGSIVAMELVED
jgi:hypothetical protein